jgi:hypothetical protein
MIEHYTIKFGPAVSQKELEKALHESGETPVHSNLHKMKARIEIIADFEDLKTLHALLKKLALGRSPDQPSISQAKTD